MRKTTLSILSLSLFLLLAMSVSAQTDTTPPTTPTGGNQFVDVGQITLFWIESQDPESGIDHYNIYRRIAPDPFVKIGESTTDEFTDTTVEIFTQYEYNVSAVNGDGLESTQGLIFSILSLDPTRPTTPLGLQGTTTHTTISLSWEPSSDPESGVSFYKVYYERLPDFVQMVETTTDTSYTIAGLDEATTYFVNVSAVNGYGELVYGPLQSNNKGEGISTSDFFTTTSDTPFCGDSVVDPGEECDSTFGTGNFFLSPTSACSDVGFEGGQLLCVDCQIQTFLCSNGAKTPTSVYDSTNVVHPIQQDIYGIQIQDAPDLEVTIDYLDQPQTPLDEFDIWISYQDNEIVDMHVHSTDTTYEVSVRNPSTGSLEEVHVGSTQSTPLSYTVVIPRDHFTQEDFFFKIESANDVAPKQIQEGQNKYHYNFHSTFDTTLPIEPSDLTATQDGLAVHLTWTEGQDPETGIDHYIIYRRTAQTVFSEVGQTADLTFVDSTIAEEEYIYQVTSVNGQGRESALGAEVSITISGPFVDSFLVIDNSLTADDLAQHACGLGEIAPDAVDSTKIVDGSITASDLAVGSVSTSQIVVGAVGTAQIADDSITSDDVAPNSIGNSELIDNLEVATLTASGSFPYLAVQEIATGALGLILTSGGASFIGSYTAHPLHLIAGQNVLSLDPNGLVTIASLQTTDANSFAYVCVDASGNLVRSNTACDQLG